MNLLLIAAARQLPTKLHDHPARWGCLALLLIFGPGIGCVLVAALLLVSIGAGAGGSASAAPTNVPGIPPVMLTAYLQATQRVTTIRPYCTGMRWSILAGIAQEESHHAAGHAIAPNGDITPPILGPLLDGSGTGGNRTPVHNPDGSIARAVGPFQLLTTTWAVVGQDGNGDGRRDPQNAFDAALSTAAYLCGPGPRNLSDDSQLRAALYSYDASQQYVDTVLGDIHAYDTIGLYPTRPGNTPATGRAKTVIDAALAQQGVPYAWGGGTASGPSRGVHDSGGGDAHGDYTKIGFDCSGLTLYAYAQVGITLPHSSSAQFTAGTRVPQAAGLAALQPADLVFYSPGLIHHVGIYLGNGQIVDAPYSGSVVRIDTLDLAEYAGGVHLLD